MPKAKIILKYKKNNEDQIKKMIGWYFLNSEDIILPQLELGIWNAQKNLIKIIINKLNFELGVYDSNLHCEIEKKKYKIIQSTPISGYGQMCTKLIGIEV